MPRMWLCISVLAGWLASAGVVLAQPNAGPGGAFVPSPEPSENCPPVVGVPVQTEGAFPGDDCPPGRCAWDSVCEAPCCEPLRYQLSLGYSLVWFSKNRFPGPAITTGDPNAPVPGAIGDPSTIVLAGTSFGTFPA